MDQLDELDVLTAVEYGQSLKKEEPPKLTELSEPEEIISIEGLGQCDILHIHDHGDLTVKCGGQKFIVTSEGDVFEQTDFRYFKL